MTARPHAAGRAQKILPISNIDNFDLHERCNDCGSGLYCESGFDGGYCTGDCASTSSDCPTGSTCFDIGSDDPYEICFLDCTEAVGCERAGYVCDVLDGVGSCIPG